MNTPAHVLVGVALCSRQRLPRTGRMAAFGSLLPDLSLYLLAGVSLIILQIPAQRVFGELYFSPGWQGVFAVDNSFIVWGLALLMAGVVRNAPAMAFAAGGLLHVATDFPLHNDDARRHFWPISDWVFVSPLSYWDSQHRAAIVAPVELLFALASAVIILRRWPSWGVRIAVAFTCLMEIWVVRQWLLFF